VNPIVALALLTIVDIWGVVNDRRSKDVASRLRITGRGGARRVLAAVAQNLRWLASPGCSQAEVGAAKVMIERTEERFNLKPERLVGDTAYGAAPMLNWLVEEKGIAPHIPVFDRSKRDDGTLSRSDFRYDPASDVYHGPRGKDPDDNWDIGE